MGLILHSLAHKSHHQSSNHQKSTCSIITWSCKIIQYNNTTKAALLFFETTINVGVHDSLNGCNEAQESSHTNIWCLWEGPHIWSIWRLDDKVFLIATLTRRARESIPANANSSQVLSSPINGIITVIITRWILVTRILVNKLRTSTLHGRLGSFKLHFLSLQNFNPLPISPVLTMKKKNMTVRKYWTWKLYK